MTRVLAHLSWTTPLTQKEGHSHYFSGYYGTPVFDASTERLLAMKAPFIDRMPEEDDELMVGFFRFRENNTFIQLSDTKAWNWQQGCMLQWIGPDFSTKVIYNNRIDNKFVSVLIDLESRQKKFFPMAVYALHPHGKTALCIDNERHYWFRSGYSYQGIMNEEKRQNLDEKDGIWRLNLYDGTTEQIINITDLLAIRPAPTMKNSVHYLEHIVFSPSGKRFCFLHRWITPCGRIHSRLFSADLKGGSIHLLSQSERVSHFCWRDDTNLLVYGSLPTLFNAVMRSRLSQLINSKPLKTIYHLITHDANAGEGTNRMSRFITGDCYFLLKDKTMISRKLFTDRLNKDGHPSFCPIDKDWFITDTYPDKNNDYLQTLFMVNIDTGDIRTIDTLSYPSSFYHKIYRCDLHPKWSYDGRYIAVDTISEGVRRIFIYEVQHLK